MTKPKTLPAIRPVTVELINGQPTTTSVDVAVHFGKRHGDVLRAIRELDCSPEFNERNFAPVDFTDAKGERRPAVRMTHNGFSFLCMGFTGPQAAKWKEAYIAAFSALEAQQRTPPVAALPPVTADLTARFVTAATDLYNVLHVHSHYDEARFLGGFLRRVEWSQAHGKSAHFTPDDVAQCRAAAHKALDRMYAHKVVNFKGYRVVEEYLDRLALHVASPDAVTARVEAEIHHRVHFSRFLLRMEADGLLRLNELPSNAHIVTPEDFAKHVATLDRKDLPAVIAAAVARLT